MGQIVELSFLIGKRVKVKNCVKLCYNKELSDVIGKLSFIGSNDFTKWPLQVTIDRTPFKIDNLNQIELLEDEIL